MSVTRMLEWLGRGYVGLLLAFLYLPIVIMALMSFNASPFYQLPFEWTTTCFAARSCCRHCCFHRSPYRG
jgi:spermidine/putrescine transport system permease protein